MNGYYHPLLAQSARTYRRFEREHVNALWQGDAMVGPRLPDPERPGKKRRGPRVILDEAHLLTQAMLEQLRLLFSDKMDSQSLATLLPVGHPDLRRTLHLTVHEALNQRLTVREHLGPLDLMAGLMDQKALLDESTVREAIARSLVLCAGAHGPAVDLDLTPPFIPACNTARRNGIVLGADSPAQPAEG